MFGTRFIFVFLPIDKHIIYDHRSGLYSIKQGQIYGKENETKAGLNMVKWGLDGMIDLMMDLRPDSTATQLVSGIYGTFV